MKKTTRWIGYIVLALTEALIIATAVTHIEELPSLVGSQVIVFCTIWGAVGLKNVVDMKRNVERATTPPPQGEEPR